MAGIFEFVMAVKAAQSAAAGTLGVGACSAHIPLSIGEIEARLLSQFSPDDYNSLISSGVAKEDMTVDDVDLIAGLIGSLKLSATYSSSGLNEHFYKHAISVRCNRDLLLLNGTAEAGSCASDSKIIGNNFQII
jgi:hypothetical protein